MSRLALVLTQLVLMALTAWRLTHLVVADDFPPIRAIRGWLTRGPEWLGDLVTCAYCAGVWISAVVVGAAELVGSVPRPWFQFGAVAAAVPLIEATVDRLEYRRPEPPPAPATYSYSTGPGAPTTYAPSARTEGGR